MAEGEGYPAQVVWQETGEEHSHDNPDALVMLSLSARRANELFARFINVPGYGNVTPYEHY